MQRVLVVGTSGSGKSTFAAKLAGLLNVPHIELDELHWNPQWVETPTNEFLAKVGAATQSLAWVADGNYSKARAVLWPRADTLIWLDYPFPLVISRLLWRTLRGLVFRNVRCNGNRENWRNVFSRHSIIVWAFQSHWRNQRTYSQAMADPAYAYLQKLRFRSPKEAAAWLRAQSAAA
jgi:adenylate kinase family enzyme